MHDVELYQKLLKLFYKVKMRDWGQAGQYGKLGNDTKVNSGFIHCKIALGRISDLGLKK